MTLAVVVAVIFGVVVGVVTTVVDAGLPRHVHCEIVSELVVRSLRLI